MTQLSGTTAHFEFQSTVFWMSLFIDRSLLFGTFVFPVILKNSPANLQLYGWRPRLPLGFWQVFRPWMGVTSLTSWHVTPVQVPTELSTPLKCWSYPRSPTRMTLTAPFSATKPGWLPLPCLITFSRAVIQMCNRVTVWRYIYCRLPVLVYVNRIYGRNPEMFTLYGGIRLVINIP